MGLTVLVAWEEWSDEACRPSRRKGEGEDQDGWTPQEPFRKRGRFLSEHGTGLGDGITRADVNLLDPSSVSSLGCRLLIRTTPRDGRSDFAQRNCENTRRDPPSETHLRLEGLTLAVSVAVRVTLAGGVGVAEGVARGRAAFRCAPHT